MNVRKIYMILFSALCFCLSLSAQDAQDSTDIVAPVSGHEFAGTNTVYSKAAADSAYMENKYLDAVYMYEALLAENGESAELRYNLGNSYYKANNIAKAILNYEKALLLAPADDDIKANLEIAKSKTVDKEEAESEFFIWAWFTSVCNAMNTNQWGRMGVASFILLLICFSLYLFHKKVVVKKVCFFASILFLLFTIIANVAGHRQKAGLLQHDEAVVMTPSVTVRSTPSESGTELFIIHEGHKVKIRDGSMKDWKEISISDNQVGWVHTSAIEII